MSHLTQMAGISVQNFVSSAVGMTVAVALIRSLSDVDRRRSATAGWILTRTINAHTAATGARSSRSPRVAGCRAELPGLHRGPHGRLVRRCDDADGNQAVVETSRSGGPIASQEAIKELGTNGGGPTTRTPRIRSRTRTGSRTSRDLGAARHPVRAACLRARRDDRRSQAGRAVFGVMFGIWLAATVSPWAWSPSATPT